MSADKIKTTVMDSDKPDFVMRIGKTTYNVSFHFNPDSRETMTEKIIRMLRNEVRNSAKE